MADETPPAPGGEVSEDLSAGVSALAQALFAAGDVEGILRRVVVLAAESLDGCDHAGVFLVEDDQVTAPAATGPVAAELDVLQQQLGEGPCLDVIAAGGTVYASDLAERSPWGRWGPAAVEAGVRSALALAMGTERPSGALNCYGIYPAAFGVVDRGKAQVLATLAGLALSTAEGRQAAETRAGNLEAALATRELIGQAQGILMERERITADQAFDILRRASQHLNVRLRDIAQRLVDTGQDPEGKPRP